MDILGADLPRDISERFAYMTALITANERQVEACRDFIREHCDPEYVKVYDIYWAGNDKRRQEIIDELQTEDEMKLSLYTAVEAKKFAQDGLDAYTGIGQMYSGYLGRDKEVRGEYGDGSQI